MELAARTRSAVCRSRRTPRRRWPVSSPAFAVGRSTGQATVLFWHTGGQVGLFAVTAKRQKRKASDNHSEKDNDVTSITFLGAARTVTGSKYLLDTGTSKVLVDAGLFQGLKELRDRNWQPFPVERSRYRRDRPDACAPRSLRLPSAAGGARVPRSRVLHRRHARSLPHRPARCRTHPGRGRGQCQSTRLLEARSGAAALHRGGRVSCHLAAAAGRVRPADAGRSRRRSRVHQRRPPARVRVRSCANRRAHDSVRRGPRPLRPARCCPIRRRSPRRTTCWWNRPTEIGCTSRTTTARNWPTSSTSTAARGGRIIIPSFAIGRVEELIYWLKRLEDEKRIPVLPVFVDSPDGDRGALPLSAAARRARSGVAPRSRGTTRRRTVQPITQDRTPERQRHAQHERQLCAFCTERFRTIASAAESKQLTQSKMPAIVISASGMATGGRVLHHLKAALPDARNTVLFVGYQAAGTRGRQLVDGEKAVKIHGEIIPVHAQHRARRIHVGARRFEGDSPLARRIHETATANLYRPRRTGRRWRR